MGNDVMERSNTMPKMNPNSTVSRINSLTGAGRPIARNRNYAVGNQARAMRSAAVFKTHMSPTRFKRATGTGGH